MIKSKRTTIFIIAILSIIGVVNIVFASSLADRLSGKILLQVESNGEGWYIYPKDQKRYYLGRPDDAFAIMRQLGLGISNNDFNSFDGTAPSRLSGYILLKVEDSGKAYYVSPDDLEMHYLGRPTDAFQVMRELGLGISNNDIYSITIASKYYLVTKVVDGDTVAVDIDGQSETLRLIGIDTPETVHPTKPVECFGKEASDKAKELLNGQKVRLEADESQGERDKYGRLLRYLFLENGTNFNKLMISDGYAYEYTYNTPYKYQNEFKQGEQDAKENKKGLWEDGVCDDYKQDDTKKVINLTDCDCSGNIYNCSDFSTSQEAQDLFKCCGGVDNDIHKLDRDRDGLVCESLN